MLVPKKTDRKDTLASFMFTLSKKTGLSQIYTNHSIRATGATILGRNCSMTQICLVSCSISTCFIKGKTSYGRHYHKFCSWRATISTILNNATAQYFPVATHAADTKQYSISLVPYTCFSSQSNYDDLFCDYNTLTTVNSVTNTSSANSHVPRLYHYKFEHNLNNQQVKVC